MPSHLAQEFRELNKYLEDFYNRMGRAKKERPKPAPQRPSPTRPRGGGGIVIVPGSGQAPSPEVDIKGTKNRGGDSTPQALACACQNGDRNACARMAQEIADGNDQKLYRCPHS